MISSLAFSLMAMGDGFGSIVVAILGVPTGLIICWSSVAQKRSLVTVTSAAASTLLFVFLLVVLIRVRM